MAVSSMLQKAVEFAERPAAAAPPTAVTVSWLGGIDINLLISFLTATYLILQIIFLVWKNSAGFRAWLKKRLKD